MNRVVLAILLCATSASAFNPDEVVLAINSRWRPITTTIPVGYETTPDVWRKGWQTNFFTYQGTDYRFLRNGGRAIQSVDLAMFFFFKPIWGVDLMSSGHTSEGGLWVSDDEGQWTFITGEKEIWRFNLESDCISARVTSNREVFVMRRCSG